VCDSGSQAYITSILEVGTDSCSCSMPGISASTSCTRADSTGEGCLQPVPAVDVKKDANGNFYLVDRGCNRIGKFRANGTLVFTGEAWVRIHSTSIVPRA